MATQPKGRFAVYTNALKNISARTGTPLPSLILSFGILHELTAVVPLVGVFYASRALGVGEAIVNTVIKDTAVTSPSIPNDRTEGAHSLVLWGKQKVHGWVEEGDRWAARVGRRYGIFGYEKRRPGEVDDWNDVLAAPGHIAGDVANAVVAYGVTKALIPLRIGASLYFAPAFSRLVIEPVRRAAMRPFRKGEP
ncbi:hypothetical protein P691DRAFT_663031 [Macrolepiota fuliginosa MF-IS2]|uniref:Uncharacterized protein n=1 Tax=Macrolepiota fuliginosa MF-IS2 TaxID=1400762 RepID=A0A9P5XHI2_9AGAR|nr:hypothetical protein P691DRAFT_663031 [Macrolepiota fuliginosa MF-IS2]